MKNDWKARDAKLKKAKAAKAARLRDVSGKLDGLWTACNELDSGFTAADRKAVADASYAIRSITGGWINRR
jgi:hypothetical protein